MAVIFVRTLITFVLLIIVLRLMGKRQIGEMQPYEFVVTLIIADLACVPMSDVSIPLVYGIVSVLTLFLLHQLLSVIEQSGKTAKRIISGKPSLVINKNGVDIYELKKNNMSVEDLIESMRSAGYFSLDDLDYAIFESNGKFSAFEKTDNSNKGTSLPIIIISCGKLLKSNLAIPKLSENDILNFLKDNSAHIKDVEVMTLDGTGRVYLKLKNRKYDILNLPILKEACW